jgi:RNA polymerase sigma factor (sigma-70 family)
MNMNTLLTPPPTDDARLIERHLAGDTLAFRQIVERYQGMVCALAYSACGNVARSEDLAQEVFLAAWKQLPQLREPARLRGWLCGITRNLAHNALRREGRTPTARAGEVPPDAAADGADPREHAIGADEAALMWGALAGMPEAYREPLVLFYREHRSLEEVAATLEISEENVRQRLSRGRAMLSARMAKVVEETLERSAPTPAFAMGVLVMLPGFLAPTVFDSALVQAGGGSAPKAISAAGAAAAAAAKGGVAIKVLAAFAALPALMNGITEYLRFRAHYESRSDGDRRDIVKLHLLPLLINGALLCGVVLILWAPVPSSWKPLALVPLALAMIAASIFEHRRRKMAEADLARLVGPAFEYRTAGGFLGLPWIHVRAGGAWRGKKAAGWIAISDGVAIGGLFASAPVAVAPIGIGGVAIGLLTLGGLALGCGALGVMAAGGWAVGGMALAAHAAQGGLAVAPDFAAGAYAIAAHANDAAAKAFFANQWFFAISQTAWHVAVWAAFFGWVPPLLLIAWHLRGARSR